ncbi:shikimate kinase [Croceicoccus naphthovorans]|uniref:Shikimate kinase n=1 Tax=Croceicoccus naphthovorans TaxID=1348774 RepID=A0A0G3XIG2_9SPHN|nr:shikimate kinase [Croceicoccus naphthovorans]AKM10399.1 shikimate kinase [Croceicoccus naphthovorans]MBB3990099.1 shikimate kinase [Croceicoccus naphthovorans]
MQEHDPAPGPDTASSQDTLLPDTATLDALSQKLDRPVVLVGLMGVGKSTVGKRLAHCLGTAFVDADEEIVAAAQMPIPEIFEKFGEAYFRDGERRVIARLIEESHGRAVVIATGGGAFVDPDTRALILDRAIAVWLDSDLETLVERVSRKNTRPLLIGKDPREVLSGLMAVRNPLYAQAPVRVVSDSGPQMASVARILTALEEHVGD